MTKREKIAKKKQDNLNKIKELQMANVELYKEDMLLSDKKQRFTEEVETHERPKYAREEHFLNNKLVGRVTWDEDFVDGGSGEVITIERTRVVRINGEWQ